MINLCGENMLNGERDQIWNLIFTPEVLRQLIPGCQSLEWISPDEYRGTIRIGVAAVAGTYEVRVHIASQEPPSACRLEGVISGPTGVITGTADLTLQDAEGVTTSLTYSASAIVSGPLAGISPRLLEGIVKTLLERGFKNLNQEIRAGGLATATGTTLTSG